MGLGIKDILEFEEISIQNLQGKKIAVDSYNMIYQFLASIRQADGTSLKDSNGNVTSHLKGLFNRCVFFKKNNINPVFVFDGEAPELKKKERVQRAEKKMKAESQYEEALSEGDLESAKKYSQGTAKITEDIVRESKQLVSSFGFPIVQAPSEGEAQAASLVKKGLAWASASQDFDSLLFGSRHLIRNLSVGGKRKIPGTNLYKDSPLEYYDLKSNLKNLDINSEELIILGLLVGTDFNPGGIKGIGPKKALKLVKSYRENWEELFETIGWHDHFNFPWIEAYNLFKKMETYDMEKLNFEKVKKQEIVDFLKERDFDEELLNKSLEKIENVKTLDSFF